MHGPVHPNVRALASLMHRWGKFALLLILICFSVITVSLLGAVLMVLFTNNINWPQLYMLALITLLISPFVMAVFLYLVFNLDAAIYYLEDSAHQERLLNESMQENIRQLNSEIEERKKAFQAKRQAIDELRKEIAERKKTQDELERASHEKGEFIATLSHELRTPLNGIVGLSRRLLDSELLPEQRSWTNTIFSSAETLGNIFNDIIDLDKIGRRELDIIYQSVHLGTFIDDIANFAELLCQQKKLQFVLHTEGELNIYLKLDATRLRQVLWNLLNNAVKFTSEGSVCLSCVVNTTAQPELTFIVTDTGIGIAAHELPQIFDMYYKSVHGKQLSIMGSGIGLAVSKALAEAMQGNITVKSTLGKGSSFIVNLSSEYTDEPSTDAAKCPPLTVLLIEDIPLNAEIATGLLEQRGHYVLHAETGEDALALLETEDDIDLVLLDMQLPDMSGTDIARHIRNEERLTTLPVVILSANVRKAEETLSDIYIDGALAKPINTSSLDQLLNRLFSSGKIHESHTVKEENTASGVAEIDSKTLRDYVRVIGKDAMERSVQLFEKLLPEYIDNMREAAVQQQEKGFKDTAHKLKGAAASVALLWLQQEAARLEDEGIESENADEELTQIQQQAEQHLVALRAILERF